MRLILEERRRAEIALRNAGFLEAANAMREAADAIERGQWDGVIVTLGDQAKSHMFAGCNGHHVTHDGRRMYSVLDRNADDV